MKEASESLTLARITRPRGNKGEVAADNLAGGLEPFPAGRKVEVELPDGSSLALEIERAWEHNGRLVLKFAGFETISDAERLRLARVLAKRDDLDPLPEGEYLLDDLIGCRMIDSGNGRELGEVAEVYEPPGGVLLFSVLDDERKELLVPFAKEVCQRVDIEGRRIEVRLPDGLEELRA